MNRRKQQFEDRVKGFNFRFRNARRMAQFTTPTDIGDQDTEIGILSDDGARERALQWKHGTPARRVKSTRWADKVRIVDGDETEGYRPLVVAWFAEAEAFTIYNSNLDEKTTIVIYRNHARFESIADVMEV